MRGAHVSPRLPVTAHVRRMPQLTAPDQTATVILLITGAVFLIVAMATAAVVRRLVTFLLLLASCATLLFSFANSAALANEFRGLISETIETRYGLTLDRGDIDALDYPDAAPDTAQTVEYGTATVTADGTDLRVTLVWDGSRFILEGPGAELPVR